MAIDTQARGLAAGASGEIFHNSRSRFSRLDAWARNFRGLERPHQVMASPPTLTFDRVSGNSTLNASMTSGQYEFARSYSNLTFAGMLAWSQIGTDPFARSEPADITLSTNAKAAQTLWRIRFATTAPKVDFVIHDIDGGMTLLVDGELVSKAPQLGGGTGQGRHLYCDWGADTVTYALTNRFTINSGGAGHAVGDIITLGSGGGVTINTAPKVVVTAVSSGVVTSVRTYDKGNLAGNPSSALSQSATTGSGTGFTCTPGQLHKMHSTLKMRRYELLMNSCQIRGIILNSNAASPVYPLLPFQVPKHLPKVVIVGDSISAGTYSLYQGNNPASIAAKMLGMWDNHVLLAQGGTGWNKDSGTSLRWSDTRRLDDVIAQSPDLIVFIGSQNDTAGTPLTSAVTTALNYLLARLPAVSIVGIGNIALGVQATADAIAAGFAAASDQYRVRFVNNQNPVKWMPSETAWNIQNDAAHLTEEASEMFACAVAEAVAWAVCDMCL